MDNSIEKLFPKRILIIGQSGSGKSTLLNAIHNQDASTVSSLQEPCKTGDSASGITSDIDFYYARNMLLVDTIGLSDPRYDHQLIVDDLHRLFRATRVNFTHIIIVIPKERLNPLTRASLALMKQLFSFAPQANIFVAITKCDDGETVEQFEELNRGDADIEYWLGRCARENITTTTLRSSTHVAMDEIMRGYRVASFARIISFIERDLSPVIFPPENWVEFVKRILRYLLPILFPREKSIFNDIVEMMRSIGGKTIRTRLFYPCCPICLEPGYTDDNLPIRLEPCQHIFHAGCCIQSNDCPTCRQDIQSRTNLPVLNSHEE
jgi:GTP-binding protein EngB required for normal cell division